MILISHRGNIDSRNPAYENSPSYIIEALDSGYNVEIDVWKIGNFWFLGHDSPRFLLEKDELLFRCWCHAKNHDALKQFQQMIDRPHFFWHESDEQTITSRGFIWTHVGCPIIPNGICVLPEQYAKPIKSSEIRQCAGICSDNIAEYKFI